MRNDIDRLMAERRLDALVVLNGFGMRIEDTLYCFEGGAFRSLTPLPYELVLPMEGG